MATISKEDSDKIKNRLPLDYQSENNDKEVFIKPFDVYGIIVGQKDDWYFVAFNDPEEGHNCMGPFQEHNLIFTQ